MSSFLVSTVITHENFPLFICRHGVYTLLCRLFCTTFLNFKFSAFIGLPIAVASTRVRVFPLSSNVFFNSSSDTP